MKSDVSLLDQDHEHNGVRFRISLPEGIPQADVNSADVTIDINDQKTHFRTFMTRRHINKIMDGAKEAEAITGDAPYFSCKNLVIVEDLEPTTILNIVKCLIDNNSFFLE